MSTYPQDQAGLPAPLFVKNMSQGKEIKLIKITCSRCKASLLVKSREKHCLPCLSASATAIREAVTGYETESLTAHHIVCHL
jgi:hypothetical protein